LKIEDHRYFARDLHRDYPIIAEGKGCWLWDEAGRKYLDGCAGANVSSIGHGVTEIAEAMAGQARRIAYPPPQHFLNRPSLDLAEKLLSLAPKGYSRVMLLSGGSEAMENALKIARQYHVHRGNPSRYKAVSRWQSFHGNTLGADAVSGSTSRRSISAPMLMDVTHIAPAGCYRCAFGARYPECGILCARDLDRAIVQTGPENVSAFVAEPIVGAAAAAVTPVQEYYPRIRSICDEHGVLWIADEVMTGVGRTGKFLCTEHWGVTPDLVVLAKGLSAGYAPLAAILVSDKVWGAFEESGLPYIGGHTYNAHPVTAAVGLAVLAYVEKHDLVNAAAERGKQLSKGLQAIKAKVPMVGDVRGKGLMWGLELVRDPLTREPFDPRERVSMRIMEKAMENGLLVYPVQGGCADGRRGDGILVCPPLTITEGEIDTLVAILEKSLVEACRACGVSA
jgi:adenosylmethionine-8-amino-7-oxononanoate aminotransferase